MVIYDNINWICNFKNLKKKVQPTTLNKACNLKFKLSLVFSLIYLSIIASNAQYNSKLPILIELQTGLAAHNVSKNNVNSLASVFFPKYKMYSYHSPVWTVQDKNPVLYFFIIKPSPWRQSKCVHWHDCFSVSLQMLSHSNSAWGGT